MGGRHNTTKAFLQWAHLLYRITLYGISHTLWTRTPRWFPDPQCRTSDRQPTPSGPVTWHYNGDRRRRRLTKAKAHEDGDGRRRRQTHSGDKRTGSSLTAPLQLPYSSLTDTSLMRPAYSTAHESCSSLCSPRSSRWTAPFLSFLNLLSEKKT